MRAHVSRLVTSLIRPGLLLALLCAPGVTHAEGATDPAAISAAVNQGNEAFWQGDYRAAARAYGKAVEAGARSGDVFFNLGTAEAHQGRNGPALWALEQALLLAPDDEDAAHNLDAVRERVKTAALSAGYGESVTLPGTDDLGTGLFTAIAPIWLTLGFGLTWVALFGLLIALRRMGPGGSRTAVTFTAVITGLTAFGFGGLIAGRELVVREARYGVVVADPGRVVSGPGPQYKTQSRVLPGVKVRVRGSDGDWVHVTLPDDSSGWLHQQDVRGLIRP